MFARWHAASRLALLLLTAMRFSASQDVAADMLQLEGCAVGAIDCADQGLSFRQLRGEPVTASQEAAGEQEQEQGRGARELGEVAPARTVVDDQQQSSGAEELGDEADVGERIVTYALKHQPGGTSPHKEDMDMWHVVADATLNGWDVVRVKFITRSGHEVSPFTPGCRVLASGHWDQAAIDPEHDPLNAFRDNRAYWAARDMSDMFFLGVRCDSDHEVVAVQVHQLDSTHAVRDVKVFHNQWIVAQTRSMTAGWLQTVWAASFGLRLVAKGRVSPTAWNVRRVKVLIQPDTAIGFHGGELVPNGKYPFYCDPLESNPKHHTLGDHRSKEAFNDDGSWWAGHPGSSSSTQIFIGIVCDRPFAWPRTRDVYLDQFPEQFAAEVELQMLTHFGWMTKDTVEVGPGGLLPLL